MILEKPKGMIFREIDGEIVIITNDGRKIHMLNETASFIWKNIEKKTAISQIIGKICQKYEVNKGRAKYDILKTIKKMSERNLIHILHKADYD
jgi:hypothetical protein